MFVHCGRLIVVGLVTFGCVAPEAEHGPAQPDQHHAREVIRLPGEPDSADRPFSTGIKSGHLVFLAGRIGTDPATGELADGLEGQTRQVIENITAALTAAGKTRADLVKCTVFLVDIDDFQAMNAVYTEMLPAPRPARSTVAVSGLARDALIEIECIAG